MNYKLLILIFLFVPVFVKGQYVIEGQIVDTTNCPIAIANVLLLSDLDTLTSIGGTVSDFEGRFRINVTDSLEDYLLRTSCVGFKSVTTKIESKEIHTPIKILLMPQNETLDQVEINAKSIEIYADKKVYFSTSFDRRASVNGLDLLSLIPDIQVDNLMAKVSTPDGGSIKILINGISADETDLLSLKPGDIASIEHYELPPARYAMYSVSGVLNVITKKQIIGGGGVLNLQNALTAGFGNDIVGIKVNREKSQFSFNYKLSYRKYSNRKLDESLSYWFDSTEYIKRKNGLASPWNNTINEFNLQYIHFNQNSYSLSIKANVNQYSYSKNTIQRIINLEPLQSENKGENALKNYYFKPTLDIYYLLDIDDKQSLSINLVGTNYNFLTDNLYFESSVLNDDTLIYVTSNAKGYKYSLIGESIYTIDLDKTKISAGLWHTSAISHQILSEYNESSISSALRETYFFAEIVGRIKQLSYSSGIGVSFNSFNSKELGSNYNFISFKPSINVKYSISDNLDLKFNYNLSTINPSLSQLSPNIVYQDSLLVYSGNSSLSPFLSHYTSLSLSFTKGRFYSTSTLSFNYAKNKILPYFEEASNYILQTSINYNASASTELFIYAQYFPFKSKWLKVSFFTQFYQTSNEFNDNKWKYNGNISTVSLKATLKSWVLNFYYQNNSYRLQGQILKSIPSVTYLEVYWKKKNLTLGTGIRYPFYNSWTQNYRTYSTKIIDKIYSERIFDNANMIYINIGYNFNFGKKYQRSNASSKNEDDDSGILSTD